MNPRSVHQFNVQDLDGNWVSLKNYENKVLLIVNTASDCGFTPQLKELESLRNEFLTEDFEILAFPSNDFGGQEPLEGNAIASFCAEKYNVRFPVFDKIRVRGTFAHPLFQFLSNKKQTGTVGSVPRWNFHKYLVARNGELVDFYYPFTKPSSAKIKKRIIKLLQANRI